MPMEESPINSALSDIYDALSRNELVEASMLAEEVMGDIFRQWQKHKGDNEACELVAATCAYVAVMTAMQRHQEAYAACMTAFAYTASCHVDPSGLLSLSLMTWKILEETLNSTSPADDSRAREHVAAITSNLGSLMYKYYYATGYGNPDDPALPEAYQALRVITGLVEIDPKLNDTTKAISQLLRHSEATGLIQ